MCHKKKHDIEFPAMGFTLAFEGKMADSFIGKFLNAETEMTLEELWCYIIPLQLYDNDYGTDEQKTCFLEKNCVTDNCLKIIKKAVIANDREILLSEFKKVCVLRCLFAKVGNSFIVKFSLCEYRNGISNSLTKVFKIRKRKIIRIGCTVWYKITVRKYVQYPLIVTSL